MKPTLVDPFTLELMHSCEYLPRNNYIFCLAGLLAVALAIPSRLVLVTRN